eukprot:6214231-Karenia_brevis.AAC.1
MIGYGGVPVGNAWNPITWTLCMEIRRAAAMLLTMPQYQYLASMFGERRNPLYTRLYYALSAVEAEDMVLARSDFEAQGFAVRGVIYDGLLAEGATEGLLHKHGLVEKRLPRWQDKLFMLIRDAAIKCSETVRKLDQGKNMCIPNSCLNVGTSKVQKAFASFTRSGPHTYMTVQQHLAMKKTGQYLQEMPLSDLPHAAPGSAFILGAQHHCIGLKMTSAHCLEVYDDSYANM